MNEPAKNECSSCGVELTQAVREGPAKRHVPHAQRFCWGCWRTMDAFQHGLLNLASNLVSEIDSTLTRIEHARNDDDLPGDEWKHT